MNLLNVVLYIVCFLFFLFTTHALSYPLCTNSRTPFKLKNDLKFCPYNGTSCCDLDEDLQLENQFREMNISNPRCASLIRSILCARCNHFSAQLYRIDSEARNVPVLCDFTENGALNDFCTDVWNNCGDIPILNSPFVRPLQGKDHFSFDTSATKLTVQWKSRGCFCDEFGNSSVDESMCFDGKRAIFGTARAPLPIKGLCLEKVGHGSYINMIPHPDQSNRVFVSNQEGKIWLVTIPEVGSKEILKMDESKPFLDLTNQVLLDPESGLMGITFHPNFERNGRFFVSYNCDKLQHERCQGRCSCNTDLNCDPSKILPNNGIEPCRYHYVVAEFTANGTASKPYLAKTAYAVEVRRIFTMGLQYTGGHAGQILFGPADGYLYLMTGDGSQGVHSSNLAQNKRSLLGKILRVDVDDMPSGEEVERLSLYGNYSIPADNPYISDNELAPEVWALGFKNPWRCSFDSQRPSYFMCGDAGQDNYEEVDIVTKGGNYGWSIYEGPYAFHPANTSSNASTLIFPVSGYNHSAVDNNSGSASIIGGYFYRSMTDPCMYGRYLYTDVYQIAIWAATEFPANSGNFTTESIIFSCAKDSPIQCSPRAGSGLPDLGYVFSLAEDNFKDVYIFTSTGVYRVARPSRCNYQCKALTNFSSVSSSTLLLNKAPPLLSSVLFSLFFLKYVLLNLFNIV